MNFSIKLIWQDDVCEIKIQFLVSDVKRRHLKQQEWIFPDTEKQNSWTSFSTFIYITLISLVIATSVLKWLFIYQTKEVILIAFFERSEV